MKDGSVLEANDYWERALGLKAHDMDRPREALESELVEAVSVYWDERSVLTKFGKLDWEHEYRDMAELGKNCLYAWIRPYLFAIVFQELAKKDGSEPLKVAVLDANAENGLFREIKP